CVCAVLCINPEVVDYIYQDKLNKLIQSPLSAAGSGLYYLSHLSATAGFVKIKITLKLKAYIMPHVLTNKKVITSTDWAANHLNDKRLQFVEVNVDTDSSTSGQIPGAIGWNWEAQLQDQLRRDMVSRKDFRQLLGNSGIEQDTAIIRYGDNSNWFAARAFWL